MADPRYSLFAARAVFDPRLSATDVRVLAALGTYANKQGWCHPKQETIAIRVGLKRPTVALAIKRLAELGYLEKQGLTTPGRGRTGSKYRVKLDIDDPMFADTTSGADVAMADVGEPDIGGADVRLDARPMFAQTNSQEEHSHMNVPKKEEEKARASDDVTPDMLEALKARADGAINLTNANIHHAGALRQLLREGCVWQDIEDATDAVSGSIKARKGRPFFSWGVIRESALANRDRRNAPLAPVGSASSTTGGKRASYSDVIDRVWKERQQ